MSRYRLFATKTFQPFHPEYGTERRGIAPVRGRMPALELFWEWNVDALMLGKTTGNSVGQWWVRRLTRLDPAQLELARGRLGLSDGSEWMQPADKSGLW